MGWWLVEVLFSEEGVYRWGEVGISCTIVYNRVMPLCPLGDPFFWTVISVIIDVWNVFTDTDSSMSEDAPLSNTIKKGVTNGATTMQPLRLHAAVSSLVAFAPPFRATTTSQIPSTTVHLLANKCPCTCHKQSHPPPTRPQPLLPTTPFAPQTLAQSITPICRTRCVALN